MAKASFLYRDLSKTATITGSTTVSGLDWSQLKDVQPRHRARVAATSAFAILDLLSATPVDVAALISTSLDATATARLRMSASDPTVTSSLLYDSGVLSSITDAAWNGAVIGCLAASVTVRYLRWDVTQSASPLDIGLAPCGLLFRPGRNFSYGSQEGRADPSQRDVNSDTGAEFSFALPQKRVKVLTYSALTKAEVRGDLDAMDRLAGVFGDVLFVENPDDTWANSARDSIWGGMRPVGNAALASRTATDVFGRSFTLTERL
jgi:hypothetical protein